MNSYSLSHRASSILASGPVTKPAKPSLSANAFESPRAITKRAQILRAARGVVAEGGFRDLQMNAVAAAAGVAVGTIYRYFPSRAELCAAVVSITSQRELDVLAAVAATDDPAPRKLCDAVRTFAARALRGRRLAYALIAEPIDPEVEGTRLRYRRAIGEVFEGIIREGIGAGVFRPLDAEVAGACLVGAFMEGLVGPLAPDTRGQAARSDAVAASIAELCLAAVANGAPGDHLKRTRRRSAAH